MKQPKSQTRSSIRSWAARLGASLVFGCWSLVLSAHAQSYSIDWFTVAGGGAASTNSQFTLSGTIGQHDAGLAMTNGQFSVIGGYWVLPQAVQVEGAPTLTIAPAAPGYATVSWDPAGAGYVLQETWTLSPSTWTDSLSGATNPATVSISAPAKYFRLHKP